MNEEQYLFDVCIIYWNQNQLIQTDETQPVNKHSWIEMGIYSQMLLKSTQQNLTLLYYRFQNQSVRVELDKLNLADNSPIFINSIDIK